ncbi:SSU72, partial [Branchiostoma lanceolatum]
AKERFDIVVTCEERVYDQVVEGTAILDSQGHMGGGAVDGPAGAESSCQSVGVTVRRAERVYDHIGEDAAILYFRYLETRDSGADAPVHVINIDIQDNHEEATIGAFLICDLCQMLQDSDDLENDMDEILQAFEEKCNRPILHTVSFY